MAIGYYTEGHQYPVDYIPCENFSPFDKAYFDKSVIPMVGDVIMSKNDEYYEIVKRIFKMKEMKENGEPILCLHLIMRKIEVEKLEDL